MLLLYVPHTMDQYDIVLLTDRSTIDRNVSITFDWFWYNRTINVLLFLTDAVRRWIRLLNIVYETTNNET